MKLTGVLLGATMQPSGSPLLAPSETSELSARSLMQMSFTMGRGVTVDNEQSKLRGYRIMERTFKVKHLHAKAQMSNEETWEIRVCEDELLVGL